MIRLKQATLHKYKLIESDQEFDIESDVTVLVGMNEPGKTLILEALAISDYFEADEAFKVNTTHDYPTGNAHATRGHGASGLDDG